jgi:hypothetical protein
MVQKRRSVITGFFFTLRDEINLLLYQNNGNRNERSYRKDNGK